MQATGAQIFFYGGLIHRQMITDDPIADPCSQLSPCIPALDRSHTVWGRAAQQLTTKVSGRSGRQVSQFQVPG